MRDLGNTNQKEEAVKSGWVIDKGNPDVWECLCKAHSDTAGMMKSTKRMKVNGGWLYQVTTEGPLGYSEALAFVKS